MDSLSGNMNKKNTFLQANKSKLILNYFKLVKRQKSIFVYSTLIKNKLILLFYLAKRQKTIFVYTTLTKEKKRNNTGLL